MRSKHDELNALEATFNKESRELGKYNYDKSKYPAIHESNILGIIYMNIPMTIFLLYL